MDNILKNYYNIDYSMNHIGYFKYNDNLYYIDKIEHIGCFLDVYRCYRFLMNQLNINGYRIIKNNQNNIISYGYVLFVYEEKSFSLDYYLKLTLQPIMNQKILIRDIKEQWIEKIDIVHKHVSDYAFSFKHNQDVVSLIYYYCGIAENSVSLLNYILNIDLNASITLGFALKKTIMTFDYELLNPTYYTISSRARHIIYLFKSQFITRDDFHIYLENYEYDIFELVYLFARLLFPSEFFNCIINQEINDKLIESFYKQICKEKSMYCMMYDMISFYIALPKISWIKDENMI